LPGGGRSSGLGWKGGYCSRQSGPVVKKEVGGGEVSKNTAKRSKPKKRGSIPLHPTGSGGKKGGDKEK